MNIEKSTEETQTPSSHESQELAQAKEAAHKTLGSALERINNEQEVLPNVSQLYTHWQELAATVTDTGRVREIILKQALPLYEIMAKGTESDINKALELLIECKRRDHPKEDVPIILISHATNPQRIGKEEDIYTAAYRDIAVLLADRGNTPINIPKH